METLTKESLATMHGLTLIEFGAEWCTHCQHAQANIRQSLNANPQIKHFKIEDGKGKKLGRQFGVTLWPTLVLLLNGHEKGRVVRPNTLLEINQLLCT
jgi:thioredoxin 1